MVSLFSSPTLNGFCITCNIAQKEIENVGNVNDDVVWSNQAINIVVKLTIGQDEIEIMGHRDFYTYSMEIANPGCNIHANIYS